MRKNKSKITFIFILIFLVLLGIFVYLLSTIKTVQNDSQNLTVVSSTTTEKAKTIEEVIVAHDGTYIDRENKIIYLTFPVSLYDENGESNEDYFEDLVKDLYDLEQLNKASFTLIDEENDIKVKVVYYSETDTYEIIYNDKENFYEETDGETYVGVDNSEIVEAGKISVIASEICSLSAGNMYFMKVKDLVDEGVDLGNGYTAFNDNQILMKIRKNKVRNLIYTEKYEETVLNDITVGTSLSDIYAKYPVISGGSVESGCIYYRNDDLYIFCYKDEISFYGYTYSENTYFEDYLSTYLQDNDLETFVEYILRKYESFYSVAEYDLDIGYAHITFPSIGIDINIKDNDSTGITLYNNYYFTETTKNFVKNNQISYVNEDLLLITEEQRREGN